jgi:hypothetical protein
VTNPADVLLRQAAAEGVAIRVTSGGVVKVRGTRRAVDRWLPIVREHKPNIISTLGADTGCRWRVQFTKGEQFELVCLEPVKIHDVRRLYPTAAAVEPAPIVYKRSATDAEAAELAALVAVVLRSDAVEERHEALAVALEDPEAAIVCYRFLARWGTVPLGKRSVSGTR